MEPRRRCSYVPRSLIIVCNILIEPALAGFFYAPTPGYRASRRRARARRVPKPSLLSACTGVATRSCLKFPCRQATRDPKSSLQNCTTSAPLAGRVSGVPCLPGTLAALATMAPRGPWREACFLKAPELIVTIAHKGRSRQRPPLR